MTVIEQDWGQEIIFAHQPTYMGKVLIRRAGTRGGVQKHIKAETHYLQSGSLIVRVWNDAGQGRTFLKEPGEAWHVPAGVVHQEEAITDCVEFEVSEPTLNDRVRMEDALGVPDPGGLPSTPADEQREILLQLARNYRARAAECEQQAQ